MKETTVLQRIRDIMLAKNMSENAFAKACNIGQKTLNSTFNRGGDVKFSTLYQILSTFPDVSAEWLMRGDGSMNRQKNDEKTISITNVHRSTTGNIDSSVGKTTNVDEALNSLLKEKDKIIAQKDARITELTDTIIKLATK